MDKHYKIVIKDFIRVPILSDDVFRAMDKNNDGEVSKVSALDLRSSQSFLLPDNGNGKLDTCNIAIGRAQVGQEASDHETDSVNNVKVG